MAIRIPEVNGFEIVAVERAIELYQRNPTAGKVLLVADPKEVAVDAG